MRIPGMVSGFNTEEMVNNLMQVERMKVDRVEQNRQVALWRKEQYNSINKDFANFILNTQKDMGLRKSSSTGSMHSNSYKNLDYVKKATSSNEMIATASTTSKTVNGSYTITVNGLATGASFASTNMKENDVEKTFDDGLTFNIGEEIINVNTGKTEVSMQDIANAINEQSEKVTAFYDEKNGRLFMQTTAMGESAKIELKATGGSAGETLVNALKSGNEGTDYFIEAGQAAKVVFNGVELKYDSNDINLNGIDITLKTEGTTNINVSTNVDGMMEKIEKFINDYNDLVDKSSKLLGEKRYDTYKPLTAEEKKALGESDAKLWEEKAKSGLLNRDETIQKILQSNRNDLYGELRDKDGNKVDGFSHITQIGISTEKYARGNMGGKLQIDEEKLRKAIEEDPEGVMGLLFKEPEELERDLDKYPKDEVGDRAYKIAVKKHDKATGGLFTRVYDNLMDGMKNIISKSGPGEDSDLYRGVKSNMLIDFVSKKSSISDIDKSILDMNKQIDNLNILLARKEANHYAKFTAMEKQMHKMNGQSGWLAQQFQ